LGPAFVDLPGGTIVQKVENFGVSTAAETGEGRETVSPVGAHWTRGGRRRTGSFVRHSLSALLTAIILVLGTFVLPGAAAADPGDVGVEGPSHVGTGTPTGTKRAESVLWFNDGFWWGNLWDTVSSDFHIFQFKGGAWVDTGVTTETRANTHHDVLWDGSTLYVASHQFVNDGVPAAPGFPSTLRRYSYNASTDKYTLLSSSKINDQKTETLTIDKDTQGRLWATWQQGNKVYLNATGTDGSTWGTPFPHPGGDVSLDDTSALIAFGPGKMGLMWSKQSPSPGTASDGFYWSVHSDTDPATAASWSTPQPVVSGARQGDDHMNLKWLDSSGGRVFAAVKTSFTSSAQPLLQLLSMSSTGVWSQNTIATVSECPNRVIVLIDEAAQRLRTFATYPKPSGTTNAGVCTSSGGAIYEKSTPLSSISFTTTKTARIVDADQYVHNVSSTKQNLNNALTGGKSTANSGLMVIARQRDVAVLVPLRGSLRDTADRHHSARHEHHGRTGGYSYRHRRVVLVHFHGARLDVRVPLGRRRVRGVHVPEELHRAGVRISHL